MIDVNDLTKIPTDCSLTEFVGTTVLDTIGLVIPGIDASLLGQMQLKKPYRSLGLISSRTGAAGQINAVDEAVKSTNTEVVSIELPRDTKGWGGHGCFIIIGRSDPVYDAGSGHQPFQRSNRCSNRRRFRCKKCGSDSPRNRIKAAGIYGKLS